MQTIKVSIEPTANGYEFCNGNTAVARITNNGYGGYNLFAANKPAGAVSGLAFAVKVVSDKIEALFAALGLNVEFVNA